jgi:uncharacterized HhH-GPD family protein
VDRLDGDAGARTIDRSDLPTVHEAPPLCGLEAILSNVTIRREGRYHPRMPDAVLHFTGDPDSDSLLAQDPLALLIGFVLDQQVTLQKAFSGPLEIRRRLGTLDAAAIAAMDPAALDEAFRARPAIHRFPGNMARRVQELCVAIVRDYGGDAGRVWREARDGADLERRLRALPGIGEMKTKTLVAVLAKRLGVRPAGWEAVASSHMTLGDVDSPDSLARYQAGKRAYKAMLRAGGKED